MAIWDIFNKTAKKEFFNSLHETLSQKFPEYEDGQLLKTACIAGLLSSVAYSDMEIHENEEEVIKNSLIHWMKLEENIASDISKIAINNVKDLAGIENYTYTDILSKEIGKDEAYALLETLFEVAASDGSVSEQESEEIRIISRGLLLDNQHFIAARASVLEFLGILKA